MTQKRNPAITVEKYYRGSRGVAVMIKPAWGGGWSTWADNSVANLRQFMLFDRRLVKLILRKAPYTELVTLMDLLKLPHFSSEDEWAQVQIRWVKPGTKFQIEEYDGFEKIVYFDDMTFDEA